MKLMPWMLAAAVLVGGCAAKSQFVYDHPAAYRGSIQGGMVAAMAPIADLREGSKEIDQIFADDPLDEIEVIIHEELISTGMFREVVASDKAGGSGYADLTVETSLLKMDWEVPDYDALTGKAFAISLLTGGIGGAIYGSTEVDVYGSTSLHARVTEAATSKVLLDKTYEFRYEERMTKFECDTPQTKAKMIGESLELAVDALMADLKEAVIGPQGNTI